MEDLEKELKKYSNKEKAQLLQRFFKTGKGDYGEGDIFLGIVVPNLRKISKAFWKNVSMENIQELLNSRVHEKRLIGLFMLIEKYKEAKKDKNKEKIREIFNFYLANTKNINNWDLVDLSAPNILGDYLLDKERKVLYELVKSNNLWEKRISILSTFTFIRNKDFKDSLKLAEILIQDKHDLIHKAVGWMLREIGKRNQDIEENFLKKYYKTMPRTMLRYAIEKFDEEKRQKYLKGQI